MNIYLKNLELGGTRAQGVALSARFKAIIGESGEG
jgi:hypothetical protein